MMFDFEYFKDYVNTYDPNSTGCKDDITIIKDMLYGIGISYDNKRFSAFKGYNRFINFIKLLHAPIRERKLKRIMKNE